MKTDSPTDARFLQLLDQNRPRILKICRVYAWEHADQNDLYQEILCQIWRALPTLKEQSQANTWLYRVALNTALNFVRKQKPHRARIVHCEEETLHEFPADAEGGDGQKDEDLSRLFRAIAQLNETDKALVTLFLKDLSYEQMATVMGMTRSNGGVIFHRAKKKLSTLMQEPP